MKHLGYKESLDFQRRGVWEGREYGIGDMWWWAWTTKTITEPFLGEWSLHGACDGDCFAPGLDDLLDEIERRTGRNIWLEPRCDATGDKITGVLCGADEAEGEGDTRLEAAHACLLALLDAEKGDADGK